MEEKIVVTPNTVETIIKWKIKISYDNGANETIFPTREPFLNPAMPGLLNFIIKEGFVRQVNIEKVRSMDLEFSKELRNSIIV